MPVLFASLAVALLAVAPTAHAGIEDVEHVVVFMQENRPLDHYYSVLNGIRGINDRAAPRLPNGLPVFFQPVSHVPVVNPLCGCSVCDIAWTPLGSKLQGLIEGVTCPTFEGQMAGAVPPVTLQNGESCSKMLESLSAASLDHFPFKSLIDFAHSTCPTDATVSGVGEPELSAPLNSSEYILPFYLNFTTTSASCMPAPEMDYQTDTKMHNGGLMDAWNVARTPGYGMSHFGRADLPYYYALADAFTIGDQYFQSTFTATNPNRLHLFSGSNGLSVPNSGYNILDDSEPQPGFEWETMAETLQAANVSWKVLQMSSNFDDDANQWFKLFREAKPGTPWFENDVATVPDLVQGFADLVGNDSLPSVLYIVGPANASEHATHHPADGEALSSELISVLSRPENAGVYAKTAFILNYDEGGQFFDHHLPPVPPRNANDGKSTVTVDGELTVETRWGIPPPHPIGLGFRVPLIIVSPWTRGHRVFSEVSDHTSVIKFIEARFGVRCPNISPWRRAIVSDLTSAFAWDAPDYTWPTFPSTAGNVNASAWQCANNPPPTVPVHQGLPTQETGTREALPLPYNATVVDTVLAANLTLDMVNTGAQGMVFYVFNLMAPSAVPKKYTIEAGKSLSDSWPLTTLSHRAFNLSTHGPNGFVRKFAGNDTTAAITVSDAFDPATDSVAYTVSVAASAPGGACTFQVTDNVYGTGGPWTLSVAPGHSATQRVPVSSTGNWYDVTVSFTGGEACGVAGSRVNTYMGHVENGRVTTSDPAMATGVSPFPEATWDHPPTPAAFQNITWNPAKECATRRARLKDQCWEFGAAETVVHPVHAGA